MADSECIEMEEEDFEVVDECEGEDDDIVLEKENESDKNTLSENSKNVSTTNKDQETLPEKTQKNDASNTVLSKSTEKDDIEVVELIKFLADKNVDTNQNNNRDTNLAVVSLEIEKSQKNVTEDLLDKNTHTIDFTADISLDQLNDSDIIRNLNDIENIDLQSESFGLNTDNRETNKIPTNICPEGNVELTDNTSESITTSSEILIVDNPQRKKYDDETPIEIPTWYEEKLNGKIKTAKERLTKLSRVLKRSYGCYQECLDRVEASVGTPVCKLFSPRRCPLYEPYINRWRFVCTKKPLEEPAIAKMEEDNIEMTIDKKVETVWQLEPSEGLTENNDFQKIPTFVMRVVKIFEDYINSNNQQRDLLSSFEEGDNILKKLENDHTKDVQDIIEQKTENEKNSPGIIEQDQWLWLLVRSNSKNELMLFATGKCISNSTMESMKYFFEKGKGVDCNVKSLYCKSLAKVGDVSTTNTTFLLGTEALDETIGGLKIQLAPKTNFWLSTVGAEQLAKEVEIMIVPNPNTVVLDIGCGLGLIGLIMAPKCEKVIGIDSPSEIEEAEMTCELNKITNASFVMGDPKEMITTLSNSLVTKKTSAIINANAEVGRNIEIITGLRKIPSLRRVVMITTLTKQSVHSILKLIQPADDILGDPFVPIRAIVVDTLPIGPQFEVVIRMDRRPMHRIFSMHLSKPLSKFKNQNSLNSKIGLACKSIDKKIPLKKFNSGRNNRREANKVSLSTKIDLPKTKGLPNQKNRSSRLRRQGKKLVKNPFYDTPPKPWEKHKPNVKIGSKNKSLKIGSPSHNNDRKDKKFISSEQKDVSKRKREWEGRNFGPSNLASKKLRNDDDDLRFRLSNNRMNSPDLIQQMEKQQQLLEVAKQKLSGSRTSVDSSTAKQLQNMLKMAIENTSQVQSHLRRSVWDRIAPHDKDFSHQEFDSPPIFKGRHVKELDKNDIIITTSNDEFVSNKHQYRSNNPGPPPAEPNLIVPKEKWITLPPNHKSNFNQSNLNQISQDDLRNREESNKTRWTLSTSIKRLSPSHHYDELSTSRRLMSSPPPWSSSPKDKSQYFQHVNRSYDISLMNQRQFSPPRRILSPQRQRSPLRHRGSTPVRRLSPIRKQSSPTRIADDWDIPTRGTVEQHPNWQRGIGRPQNVRQDPPPLMQLRTTIENTWNANKKNDTWKSSGTNDSWKNQQMSDKRYSNQSNDSWNNHNMDVMNPGRNSSWMDKRWDSPHNLNIWNKGGERDKEDWHDLPEDARDPWGDDGGIGNLGMNDRWKQCDNPQPSSSNNWGDKNVADWSNHNDDWQKKNQIMNMMNNKPWQGNIESNQNNNSRWNLLNNTSPQQALGNWKQGNVWRDSSTQNLSPFQRLRYFNCNLK